MRDSLNILCSEVSCQACSSEMFVNKEVNEREFVVRPAEAVLRRVGVLECGAQRA